MPPSPCMPCAGSARLSGSAPFLVLLLLSWGVPLLLLGHVVRWVRTLPYGGLPLPLGSACVPKARAIRPLPTCLPVSRGSPLPSQACYALGAHAAVQGGSPCHPGSGRALWVCTVCPPSSCLRVVCARGWGRGSRTLPWPCLLGWSQGGVFGGSPPRPCCTPMTRAAGWGFLPPLPPLFGRSR